MSVIPSQTRKAGTPEGLAKSSGRAAAPRRAGRADLDSGLGLGLGLGQRAVPCQCQDSHESHPARDTGTDTQADWPDMGLTIVANGKVVPGQAHWQAVIVSSSNPGGPRLLLPHWH